MTDPTPNEVAATLSALGVFPTQAQRAADDSRIRWTDAALEACAAYIRRSTANDPAAALWASYLQHGTTPPALSVAQPPAPDALTCPWCKGPIDQCQGLHGWAAAYRTTAQEGAA